MDITFTFDFAGIPLDCEADVSANHYGGCEVDVTSVGFWDGDANEHIELELTGIEWSGRPLAEYLQEAAVEEWEQGL